ncbi:guanylate kinase [Magnetospirillum fulvum]|uniref:Guanylate kinase n=1 Tax=Magnetospirillum fulvum MGU-K5 TaxID=1316936 RepID=S9TRK1_MAGFU|nr:guanylate kinase [Magnetospirillum fulvum]EPY01155.1 guanylate kinase [Magnetospirillum fulvum MGU-K5]
MSGNEPRAIARRGLMLVLSSPSGAGKTTISRALLERETDISMSVSATTRSPRPGETDGKDYHFVDVDRFHRMVEADEFLEHARVFSNFYGTPRGPVEATLAQGQDVLFDIDWQGTQQLAQNARADLVSVFILPPSLEELHRRLSGRGLDSADVVAERMAKAGDEMSHWPEYDYIVVNSDLERSIGEVRAILAAARLKRERQAGLPAFVNRLRGLDRDSGG